MPDFLSRVAPLFDQHQIRTTEFKTLQLADERHPEKRAMQFALLCNQTLQIMDRNIAVLDAVQDQRRHTADTVGRPRSKGVVAGMRPETEPFCILVGECDAGCSGIDHDGDGGRPLTDARA